MFFIVLPIYKLKGKDPVSLQDQSHSTTYLTHYNDLAS